MATAFSPIPAGTLRHRIEIRHNAGNVRSPSGGITPNWQAFASAVPAAVEPLAGRELVTMRAAQSRASMRFRIRYIAGVTSAMRVVWRGKTYEITEPPTDVDARGRVLEILATEQA